MFYLIVSLLLSFCFTGDVSASTPSVRILDSVECTMHAFPSIIEEHEWKELQLDRLVEALDRTQTLFGRWGLTYLLHPISDKNEIIKRQNIIKYLLENEDVLQQFQKLLADIKKHETALLSYWDKNDTVSNNANQFYYTLPGFKKQLNKSNVALNLGVAVQMFDAVKGLLLSLCLGDVYDELSHWVMTDQKEFNFMRGVKNGITEPIRQHSPSLYVLQGKDTNVYTIKDYIYAAMLKGSWGDRFSVLSHGWSFNSADIGLPIHIAIPAQKAVGFAAKVFAFSTATAATLAYDYFWALRLSNVASYALFMHKSLTDITQRVIKTSSCCESIARTIAQAHTSSNVFYSYLFSGQKKYDRAIGELVHINKQWKTNKQMYRYSRGHVLAMHKYITQAKMTLVPVLQTIALIDAYCSIAQLMKEQQNKKNRFCFVEFIDNEEPCVEYHNAWLGLLSPDIAVANDLFLGDRYASKMLITGPNGGGKSTILKTYGVEAVLAQGVGIACADFAQQTVLTGLKTAIVQNEDLQKDLSTFTARKKRMEELRVYMNSLQKNDGSLILVDEPYTGTIDDESAKRIYNFGLDVAKNSHTLMCIATHVEKPILLETDTGGIFANYHVEICEESFGVFKRLFTLKRGAATWWFEDSDRRGRFVDWISVLFDTQSKEIDQKNIYNDIIRTIKR